MFDWARLTRPLVLPRPKATLLDEADIQLIERLGMTAEFAVTTEASEWPTPDDPELADRFAAFRSALVEAEVRLGRDREEKSLRGAIEAFRKRTEGSVSRLEETFRKDWQRRLGVGPKDRHRLDQKIRPRGRPQERMVGPFALGLTSEDLAHLAEGFDPFDYRPFIIIKETGR